ncbi:MAG: transposase [Bryobacteraceae bacterium]|nr:transposase [Bryobacteraceae bacterium]
MPKCWRAEYNPERPHSSLAYRTPKTCSELTGGIAKGTSRMTGDFPNYDWQRKPGQVGDMISRLNPKRWQGTHRYLCAPFRVTGQKGWGMPRMRPSSARKSGQWLRSL